MMSMMETCLLMAPFLKGLNRCSRGPSLPPTHPVLESQVELKSTPTVQHMQLDASDHVGKSFLLFLSQEWTSWWTNL